MAKIRDKGLLFGTLLTAHPRVGKGVGGQSEACDILKINHPLLWVLRHSLAF